MQKIKGKAVIVLLVSILLVSPAFIGMNIAQQPGATTIYVNPPSLIETVCTEFTVDINVENVANLWAFEFWLSYDTKLLDALNIALGPFLNKPNHIINQLINDPMGWLMLAATSDLGALPANGGGTLGTVTFHCTGAGTTSLHLYDTSLWDPAMIFIQHGTEDGIVTQETVLPWYVKPSYPDYAPSGMPDIDQKQDNWGPQGMPTWCGPVSVANSLWWLDSEFESIVNPFPVPPPAISDHYNLVTSYSPQQWDDHDVQNVGPFVRNLAFLMDADGIRTMSPLTAHTGTFFKDMEAGISQYIAQQGLNPTGDCDGDGDVDYNDMVIVAKAFNSVPGSVNWNMAADISPPYNIVGLPEITTVANNYGMVGSFYERTVEFPEFPWIEEEVYRCEDVVLLLEFWQFDGVTWTKWEYDPGGQGGHYVTVAGVNSTTSQLLISDPFWDAFEAGLVPGSSPVAHGYPHGSDLHNDTQYVSHDAYLALPWMLPSSPYPAGISFWELMGYLQVEGWDPSFHAFIRAAVATSPQTIAASNVVSSKDNCQPKAVVGKGYSTEINATLVNQGLTALDFTVTVYANSTILGTTTVNNLAPGASININVTTWDTTTWAYGEYFLTAATNASYPTFTSAVGVWVVIPGDVDCSGAVNILDAIYLSNHFGETPSSPGWNQGGTNADIDCSNGVNILDAIVLSNYFNQVGTYDP